MSHMMPALRSLILLGTGLLLVTLACGPSAQPTPTLMPTAALPTATSPAPTATPIVSIPPTLDLSTPSQEPTAPVATRMATETATPSGPAVALLNPAEGSDLILGQEITVSGIATLDRASQTILVELRAVDGRVLAESMATLANGDSWETRLLVPERVSGPGRLQVSVRDPDAEVIVADQRDVMLVLDASIADRYLALYRPAPGAPITAMAGYYLFFDGYAQRPNGLVTIAILTDNCQTIAARQSFTMRGSGYWQGFIVVPRNVSGPACAVAYTSTRGDESWREVQLPIEILPADAPEARGVIISGPSSGSEVTAGETLTLYGVAYNATDQTLLLSIVLENGRLVTQQTVDVQSFGYWETDVLLPLDVSGPAQVIVAAGEESDAVVDLLIEILPAE